MVIHVERIISFSFFELFSQLNLSISNREKEFNQTYLAEELAKMKTRKELIESIL